MVCAGVEGRHLLTCDERVERLRDVADSDADISGACSIDHDAQLRLAADERRISIDHVRQRLHLCQQRVGILSQLVQIGTAYNVLNVGVAKSTAGDCRHLLYARAQLIRIEFQELSQNLSARARHQCLLRNLSLLDRRQFHVDRGNVYLFLLAAADGGQRVSHARQAAQIHRDSLGQGRSRSKCEAFGRTHVDLKLGLVVDRQEVLSDKHEQRHDADDNEQTCKHDGPTMMHGPGQQLSVGAIDRTIKT